MPCRPLSTRPISAVAEIDGIGGNLDPDPHTFPAKSRDSRWWKADPKTGCWVPEDQFEKEINTAQTVTQRPRSIPTASLEDRGWWSSLEELPADRS
eukprot:SM000217S06865  [mRNA]  locus=s217:126960:127578:- [translate_table: standard]